MTEITDIGPKPNSFDLENATKDNPHYRSVAWSGTYLRLDAGKGKCRMGPSKDQVSFEQEVQDGWCVLVPAGTWHDVVNTGREPMRLYAIYAPVHHAAGKIHATFDDAERDEDSGQDEPPSWSVQPPVA